MNKNLKKPWAIQAGSALAPFMLCLLLACNEEPIAISECGDGDLSAQQAKTTATAKLDDSNVQQTFTAQLLGENERPTPVATKGKGQAILKLSKDGTMLSYKIIANNLENITQAHIHCGDSETAGPVVAFLFGFVTGGVTKNGVLAEGVITGADIIARPDTEQCMGGVANFDQLIEKLKTGDAYVNVHTTAYPAGEIRGQIR